jgi:RNA polymerase sigma-70 factor (ECF subfamily)
MDEGREPESVEALMEAYVGGDRDAFQRLFDRLAPQVYGFLLRRVGNPALADDMLQTTFLKFHRARADYRVGEPVRPWLFTIAARVQIDEMRRQKRRPESGEPEQFDRAAAAHVIDSDDGQDPIERMQLAQAVRQALDKLPEGQRVVVQLHRYEGFTFDQIAKMLETTEGAVKLRAFRAYERLRKDLAPLLREQHGWLDGSAQR